MLHIPKIDNFLKIVMDEEMEDFLAIDFSEYIKSIREEQNLRKVANLLYIFLAKRNEIENMCNRILLIVVYITIILRC